MKLLAQIVMQFIGESARKLEKRLSEHKSTAGSSKSAITEHVIRSKGHQIDWENVKLLEREPKPSILEL